MRYLYVKFRFLFYYSLTAPSLHAMNHSRFNGQEVRSTSKTRTTSPTWNEVLDLVDVALGDLVRGRIHISVCAR